MAEKLGDKDLAEAAIDESSLRETGFVNVDEISEPLSIERSLDEPVLFYRHMNDEQFYTLALRMSTWRRVISRCWKPWKDSGTT